MADAPVFATRVVGLPLLDADGGAVGRVDDLLLAPAHRAQPPRLLGFVASVQRRRIFVNAGRVARIDAAGVQLATGTVDLRHFTLRPGELLVRSVLDRRIGDEVVRDVALAPAPPPTPGWVVSNVALSRAGLRRRDLRVVPWREAASLFDAGPVAGAVAAYRDMHPSDVASALRRLPLERRRLLAEHMEDERLADVLEELPEDEQVNLVATLDLERLAHVLEEMAPDDAADLLAELPGERRAQVLEEMAADEAGPLRLLLRYDRHTAGGLMTPEPLVLPPTATVAEALARVRDPDLPAALAAQVFVAEPPTATPTGRFLGAVGFQRLLREPPGGEIGRCLDGAVQPVGPELSELAVAERLAAYNLVALPVCDPAGRLIGAVTVDDVLDQTLPGDWRERHR